MILDIDTIVVPSYILNSVPSERKIKHRMDDIIKGIKRKVTVDKYNRLLDGYTSYMAYKELGYTYCYAEVKRPEQVKISKCNNSAEVKFLYEESGGHCYICGRKCLNIKSTDNTHNLYPTVDHVIPLCKGGANNLDNKRLACFACNQLKGQFSYSKELVSVIKRELAERGLL